MTAFLLLLPLWVALAWAALFGLVSWRRPAAAGTVLQHWGGHVQLGILLFLLLIAVEAGAVGAEPPEVLTWRTEGLARVAVVVAAGLTGPALFGFEVVVAELTQRASARRVGRLLDGGSADLLRMHHGSATALLLVVGLPVVEELLWRRMLIVALIDGWSWPPAAAVVVAGVSFGVNHYWFGLRNIVTKSVAGIVWGAVFLYGGLLAAVIAHVSFQLPAWRRLVRQRRPDHDPTTAVEVP